MFDHDQKRQLQEIREDVEYIKHFLDVLFKQPISLNVYWYIENDDKGRFDMSSAAVALNLSSTAKAVGVISETNNDGSVFKFDPTKIQAVAQDTSVLTVTVDPTTGNVTVVPLKVGSTAVAVGDSVTGISAPVTTFTVTSTGPTPSSLSVSWTTTP
jgi:hypothetical protein